MSNFISLKNVINYTKIIEMNLLEVPALVLID